MCEIIYNFQIWTMKLSCIYKKTENIMEYKVNLETGTKRVKSFPSDLSKQWGMGLFQSPSSEFLSISIVVKHTCEWSHSVVSDSSWPHGL